MDSLCDSKLFDDLFALKQASGKDAGLILDKLEQKFNTDELSGTLELLAESAENAAKLFESMDQLSSLKQEGSGYASIRLLILILQDGCLSKL